MQSKRFKEYNAPEQVPTRRLIDHPSNGGAYLPVHTRPMRKSGVDYSNPEMICFVTFRVKSDCTVRFKGDIGSIAWRTLTAECQAIGCRLYAACMMPDHVHILLSPGGNGESVSDIVRRIKSLCAFSLRNECNVYLTWQTSFYDHILRDSELMEREVNAIKQYIIDNPFRAGIDMPYPFTFCDLLDG